MCPYKYAADDWKDDPTEWPDLSYHHLYHYLIKTPSKIFNNCPQQVTILFS
jgi:hypothetical protein